MTLDRLASLTHIRWMNHHDASDLTFQKWFGDPWRIKQNNNPSGSETDPATHYSTVLRRCSSPSRQLVSRMSDAASDSPQHGSDVQGDELFLQLRSRCPHRIVLPERYHDGGIHNRTRPYVPSLPLL